MADSETYTVDIEGGITLSKIIWQRFHRPMPGLVERIMATTPSLSASGPLLQRGTVVVIPIDDDQREGTADVVSLWD